MQTAQLKVSHQKHRVRCNVDHREILVRSVSKSWSKIAPFWPLQNLIAVNPLAGFEDLPFRDALKFGIAYFQQADLPNGMQIVNLHSIKWLQAYFDQGQSTIRMPKQNDSFMQSILALLPFDDKVISAADKNLAWLQSLPTEPIQIISNCLNFLKIPDTEYEQFLTLMLTTLYGWSSYVTYIMKWSDQEHSGNKYAITEYEYLAIRLVLTCMLWPQARDVLSWHYNALKKTESIKIFNKIQVAENDYLGELLSKLKSRIHNFRVESLKAQLVFCIDVRSEPFRRAIENQNGYQTFGFAGFFGLPIRIDNKINGESYASCPVLLKPAHNITNLPFCSGKDPYNGYSIIKLFKQSYRSLKYSFTTPFALVEMLGVFNGFWMALKSLFPWIAALSKKSMLKLLSQEYALKPIKDSISLDQQAHYALSALRMMGLINNFSDIVVFVGHGSTTENNAYATSLDCGACGGRHGASNAQLLADILNDSNVRHIIKSQGINIPETTYFLGAEHNTTTDLVELYDHDAPDVFKNKILHIKQDLEKARQENCWGRAKKLGINTTKKQALTKIFMRSLDWAQVRPEWGLAKNASFIIGPRYLTQHCDLDGRSFLHSYDWHIDHDKTILTTILTAPVIVAQWINSQYMFSTLDNVAYGGGSKITKNITGKIAIMQGNASDLMTGLPLQSVHSSDDNSYHEVVRLTVVVYAPKSYVDSIISQHIKLQNLFRNEWLKLICIEPATKDFYCLERNFEWSRV